jgi:DNA-binding NarL/FixJ family response regulator
MNESRILIADDHAMIRNGVRGLLSGDKELVVVGEASTGAEAVTQYKILKPDLLILDISMPDMNGMEVANTVLKDDPAARIIILSMYDDEDYISRCVKQGVKGYVVKNESGAELTRAVKSVLRGKSYFSHQVQQSVFKKYSDSTPDKKIEEPEDDLKLTSREVEIVRLIAEGLTSHQMAEKLLISARTVETHRANLLKKVGVKNAIELVKKIEKLGII